MESNVGVDDVTKKIKIAITNKLIDLGSYVDEELPDYIMVMVANKKTHTQMTNDLNLFLGANTQNFTTWLHGILETVQTGSEDSHHAQEKNKDDKKKSSRSEIIKEKESTNKKSTEDKSETKSHKQKGVDAEVISTTDTREENEDVISFRTETDDVLTKELQQEDEKLIPPKTTKLKKSNSAIEKTQNTESTKRLPISFPKREETKTAIKIRPMLQRKGPISTVSSVIRKPQKVKPFTYDDTEEDDDEYDPCKPSVGTVASVVRVTERRSSIPPELQANKLLLFKAIEDANKSITKKSSIRGSARVAPYKPTAIQVEPPIKPVEKPPIIEIKEKSPEPIVQTETEDLKMEVVPVAEEMLQVLTMKKQSPLKVENVTNKQVIEVLEEMDPSILVTPSSTVIVTNSKKGIKRKIEDEALENQTNLEKTVSISETSSHTRFVVTLDGINPSNIFKRPRNSQNSDVPSTKRIFAPVPSNVDEEMYDELEFMETENEFDDDDNDTLCIDYNDAMEEMSDVVEKKSIRCQFWPACVRGENCIYIHPTQPCKNFPACHFGSKCIKIHPNCKFDSQCKRPDCPFTHASKRNTVALAPIQIRKPKVVVPASKPPPNANVPICKFFPKCTNTKCIFIHPKMCRYGSFCKTQGCPFTHPKTPSVEKLKWTATNKT